jgi:tripartite-type tricarboxylate transporter receptor subunit TctC
MIPKKPAPHLMRGGHRFPACAKPWHSLVVWTDASAGVGRSEKIMLHQVSLPDAQRLDSIAPTSRTAAYKNHEGEMDRRTFLGGAAALPFVTPSFAQDYPSRPVTFINPFPPGGAADVVARPLAAVLEPMVRQPVVIETKAGAAGAVGAQFAANAKPDGYTLLTHITSISGFAEVDKLFGRTPKFTRADFIPIARFIADPMIIVVNDQQPYKMLKEFVDAAKAKPNEIVMSSSGLYGALHLPMALFNKKAGITLRHLPTQGGGPAITALLGNNAQVLCSSIAAASAQVKAGKLKPLASFGAARAPLMPDVPTLKELGYDLEFYLWVGLFAPKATPEGVISYWRDMSRKAAATDAFVKAMANIGQQVAFMDQPEFRAFWDADAKRVEEAVQAVGKMEG